MRIYMCMLVVVFFFVSFILLSIRTFDPKC